MIGDSASEAANLESALLFFGRSQLALAGILCMVVEPAALEELAKSAGRRKAGRLDPAQVVADGVLHSPRFRREVAEQILAWLPPPVDLPGEFLAPERAAWLRRETLLGALRHSLCGGAAEDWQRAAAQARAWAKQLAPREAPRRAAGPAPAKPAGGEGSGAAEARLKKLEKERSELQGRMQQELRETARLQDELGRERKRGSQLREELADARGQLEGAAQRAAEMKRRWKNATLASAREQMLEEEAEEARRELQILRQKFEILQEERDDLHAVLEDNDRYLEYAQEEVPSFRERPLQPEENELAARLAARTAAGIPRPRILVVGGGEPQRRHVDKFREYAERLGFHGVWRMAEYSSWHKEMDTLAADMERNFDALVILHWNRTTFTRKAREICNKKGQKPCFTCHYEGFVSLRLTLQLCLRQLLGGSS